MHYIYILGLEHSGTTLTEDILSRHPNAIGVGEAANFCSDEHMREYYRRWGDYSDARTCSCGAQWDKCDFWSDIVNNPDYAELDFYQKYQLLLNQFAAKKGDSGILIDSSKSLAALEKITAPKNGLGLSNAMVHAVFNIKDVRSFAQSMVKKSNGKLGLIGILRAFNLWIGVNQNYLRELNRLNIDYYVNRYEAFCEAPFNSIVNIYQNFDVDADEKQLEQSDSNSHIAIGNKDYVLRNRDKIRYDDSWTRNWRIKLAYALHTKARRINEQFKELQ